MSEVDDHPHSDPGDGRTECLVCGKWVFQVTHSCKGVPVTNVAIIRYNTSMADGMTHEQWRCMDPAYAADEADARSAMNGMSADEAKTRARAAVRGAVVAARGEES